MPSPSALATYKQLADLFGPSLRSRSPGGASAPAPARASDEELPIGDDEVRDVLWLCFARSHVSSRPCHSLMSSLHVLIS
jgi:hypothetical protein